MNLTAMAGVGIVAAVLTLLFKQYKPEYTVMISLCCTALFFGLLLAEMIPVFSILRDTAERTGVSTSYVKTLLKCLGVCYLTETAGQICKEAGQLSAAFQLELAGRVMILLLALPLFSDLLEIVLTLLS